MKYTKEKLCSIFLMILTFLSTVNLIHAQDKNAPVNIKTNLIVLDAKQKNVDDIKQADIKISEDGVEQKITYFAKKEPILNVGFVIDNSSSLGEKLNEIMFIGSTMIENLRPDDKAFMVRFVSHETIETVQDWTSDKKKLKIAVENMYVQGGVTAISDAIYLSAEKILEREKEKKSEHYALVLISDGVERESYYKLDQLFSLFKDSDVQIFSISFPEEDALNQIKDIKKTVVMNVRTHKRVKEHPILLNNTLATETGGTAYTLSKNYTNEELITNINAIFIELRSNYVVGYTSINQKRDGKERSLRVEIADGENGAKRSGFVREKFKVLNIKDITK